VIGFLNGGSPDAFAPMVAAFHEGLKEPVAAGLHEIGYAGRLPQYIREWRAVR
jgi:hypothetical protein